MVERIDPREMAKAAAAIAVVTWMAAEMETPVTAVTDGSESRPYPTTCPP